jgi:hypothetical protein
MWGIFFTYLIWEIFELFHVIYVPKNFYTVYIIIPGASHPRRLDNFKILQRPSDLPDYNTPDSNASIPSEDHVVLLSTIMSIHINQEDRDVSTEG